MSPVCGIFFTVHYHLTVWVWLFNPLCDWQCSLLPCWASLMGRCVPHVHCTALYFNTLHCCVLHCIAVQFTKLHCPELCAVLHCTSLHWSHCRVLSTWSIPDTAEQWLTTLLCFNILYTILLYYTLVFFSSGSSPLLLYSTLLYSCLLYSRSTPGINRRERGWGLQEEGCYYSTVPCSTAALYCVHYCTTVPPHCTVYTTVLQYYRTVDHTTDRASFW